MLTLHHGDIFAATSEIITITVNCVGVMGAGLALQARSIPGVYDKYRALYRANKLRTGQPICITVPRGRFLLFPTKAHWRDPSRLEWVTEGLDRIAQNSDKFESIALPPVGCGYGGLHFSAVYPEIRDRLKNVRVDLYPPKGWTPYPTE